MNREAREPEAVQEEDAKQCAADGDKICDAADPEIFAESVSRRQAVLAPGASLDSRHNERRNCGETQQRTFEQSQTQRRGAGNLHANLSLPMRKNLQANEESKNHAAYERQKNQYAPARADAIRAAKNRARLRRWGSSCGERVFGHERITFEIEQSRLRDLGRKSSASQENGSCPEQAKRVGKEEGFSPVPYSSATARCNSSAIFAGSLPA